MNEKPIDTGEQASEATAMLFSGLVAAIAAPPALQKVIREAAFQLQEKDKLIATLQKRIALRDEQITKHLQSAQPTGIHIVRSPLEVLIMAQASLLVVERMVTDEGRKLNPEGCAKLLEVKEVADRLVHNPKAMDSIPITGAEWDQIRILIGSLRRAAKIDDSVSAAGVLEQAAKLLDPQAKGDASNRIGGTGEPQTKARTPTPIVKQLHTLAKDVERANKDLQGLTIDADSCAAILIRDISRAAAQLQGKVPLCR